MLGPHNKVQQYLVAGIFSNWQVPVRFDFHANVDINTLFGLICGVEAAGARLVATVSDMGGGSQGVWKELGVSHDGRTWFPNPADPSRLALIKQTQM